MNPLVTGRSRHTHTSRGIRTALAVFAAAGIACASVAVGAAAAAPRTTRSSASPIVVWVDSTRVPMIKAYEKANPTVKIDLVIYNGNANGSGYLQSKIALDNRVGAGWPDIVFSEENNDASSLANAQFHYPAALSKGLVSKSVLNGFAKGTIAGCTIDGTVYCLRNDLAQNVLWYNSALMKKFGYKVPTTWQQYQALGQTVAKQHPGYIIGSANDTWTEEIYLWGSACPMNYVTGPLTVDINLASSKCTRMASLLDSLVKAKSVNDTESVFSSSFDTTYAVTKASPLGHVLMMPGPSWYGADLLVASNIIPKGDIGAADPLAWAGSPAVTGEVGGGLWFMSSHSKNKAAVASMLVWLSTSAGSQGISVGYPAFVADQTSWIAGQQASGDYATQLGPVFATAATEVWSDWGPVPYSTEAVWADTVTPALVGGGTITSQLANYGTQLTDFAQSDGYTVVTKP